eukprot:CAMPEP_0178936822 /NCGR_PEP_ID=MMETSP0786-20121207/25398_1 /TAXON_ID=186022 /ORGANISM="Thalassionema frauenfeldii, Strain CCMP 1798" /LENGTH=313 /DNA_ID=CAMNT_0020615291 /DNA_START=216 /DNA_END=1157 /DNA_ORIENTATION=-
MPNQYSRHSSFFTLEETLPSLQFVYPTSELCIPTDIPYSKIANSIPVVYTNSPKAVDKWLSDNVSQYSGLGLDVESNRHNHFNPGPATVQLATPTNCLVVHLVSRSGNPIGDSLSVLEPILMDETIIKTGVAVDHDIVALRRKWGDSVDAKSRLELGGIGCEYKNGQTVSLKRLSKAILGIDLPKSKALALSSWNRIPLTKKQVAYSARDAWAGAAILQELTNRDPETFSPESLRSMLMHQPTIDQINSLALLRKEAREARTNLLASKPLDHARQKLSGLSRIIKSTAPEKPKFIDVSSLGIIIDPPVESKKP